MTERGHPTFIPRLDTSSMTWESDQYQSRPAKKRKTMSKEEETERAYFHNIHNMFNVEDFQQGW
ncbi:MAG: hypothetical protein M3Y53_00490 [Thermoproteota archaeon]|nr:hypothetical protein [Thermoproteota archaeon]